MESLAVKDQETDIQDQMLDEESENVVVADFRMVTFSLAGKDYAIDIMHVKEIAKASRFTYVPNTMPFVIGVYNLRGEIIPIIDLRKFFGIEVPPRTEDQLENMLIITVEEHVFGFVVDKIDRVVGVQKSTIQPPHPIFGDINIKFIYGIVEYEKHLFVLLDIARIFNQKISDDDRAEADRAAVEREYGVAHSDNDAPAAPQYSQEPVYKEDVAAQSSAPASEESAASQAASPAVEDTSATDKKFICDGLAQFKKFYISDVNRAWFDGRFNDWAASRKGASVQLQSEAEADEFLSTFWSSNSGAFWKKDYADALFNILPENNAKQILVWNPGCGKGYESFSLACVLKKRYPSSKIRIYAHETDLLNISNAPLLTVPIDDAQGWLSPYVQKSVTGEYTFTQEIKDIIMFEYHDITNSNALPMTDIIFARDVVSLFTPDAQKNVLADFEEKLKGNGILFLGENESVGTGTSWGERTEGSLTYFNK
ncbi:MAG: chemotaxis protein CheW [Treponema sp.]|nr:chemotaxis protein CheW [Treponema sp.]